MSSILIDKKILLGITGSISAYKAADWVRALKRDGAHVQVIMTESGARFVTPLTFAALTGNRVWGDMFAQRSAEEIPHIALARDCDLLLIAPATAQTIARLAHGAADDLLSTVTLATEAKVLVCPAMNSRMFLHPATQENLARIKRYGYTVVEPDAGMMACGDEGPGRLPEWERVRHAVLAAFAEQDLEGLSVLVTAGPTHEPLDPVRFLTNRSSGKMGFALAAAARQRGASVTLISGPVAISPPPGVQCIQVTTAGEMYDAVLKNYSSAQVVVKAAAVSDYRPATVSEHKLKKGEDAFSLPLVANRDILKELGRRKETGQEFPLLVGFAAESRDHAREGLRKLREKNLDLIAVNDIAGSETGFAVDTNKVTLIDRSGTEQELPLLTKEETANRIWNTVVKMLAA